MRANDVLALVIPSETTTVIVAVPNWLASGNSVKVRSALVPVNNRFGAGSRFVFDEKASTTRLDAAVSKSDTVNAMGARGTFSVTF